jgi:hypothetical protein
MRFRRAFLLFLLLFLFLLPGWGISLSNVAISDVGTNYCRVVADLAPDAYVQVYWGTATGGPYPYNTYVYLTGKQTTPSDSGHMALDLGALSPNTDYYAIIVARPTINTTTGQVQSSEIHCHTNSGTFPIRPQSPTVYSPAYPDTSSGYTTISLITSGGAYVAASTVTHTGGIFCANDPSWTVNSGDSIPTILGEIKFGAIIEFPQGATGSVPDTNNFNGGFTLPVIAVDPCASGISDPNHRWIIFRTQQVNAADFPPFGFRTGPAWASKLANLQAQQPNSVIYVVGQIFSATLPGVSATPIHHFWFSNLEFSVNGVSSNGPWGSYFAFGNGEGNPPDAQTPPSYLVLDRIYFNTPPPPAFPVSGVFGNVGTDVMMIGNYIVGFQRSGGLGMGIYIEDCSTGPLSILNNEVDAAGQGIYFESVSSTGCGNNPPVMMQNVAVEKNTLYEPPSWLNPVNAGYGAWDGVTRGNFRNPFESKNCQICLIQGNWIDGSFSGQNSGEAFLVLPPVNANKQTGATGAHDLEISWNYVRHAAVFADVWGTSVIDACCGYAPDAALTSNVMVDNNLGVDLGRYLYTAQGSVGGLYSNYFISYGVQNHLIYNNSLDLTNADFGAGGYFIPDILGVSDGGISSNGFQFTGNLLYFSQGVTGSTSSGIIAPAAVCPGGCATFPVVPLPLATTYATILQTTMVQIASSISYSGFWLGNVIICGNKATGAEPWPDMTQGDCTTQAKNMPPGDLYPPGNTMAARQAAAGLLGIATKDMRVTPTAYNFGGAVGADIQGLISKLGIVKNIAANPRATSIQFTYTAPDSSACSVDTSPDGMTWTRTTDSGGARDRTLLVTELPSRTSISYRILCYYSQSSPWFSFPSEPSNMATEGTISTTPRVVRNQ